jgi:hypothetical protein
VSKKKQSVVEQIQPRATEISYLSVDLGNAFSSIRADRGITADWRSIQGIVSNKKNMKEMPFDSVIKYDGQWHVFGSAADRLASRVADHPSTERYTSDWYKRLFAFALHKAYGLRLGEGIFYPQVVSSIPAREYASDVRVQKVKENLLGTYFIENTLGGALQVVIDPANLTIIPEGAGTFFHMLDQGDLHGKTMYAKGLYYVIDIGYLTTDIIAFQDGEYLPELATSDPSLGMRFVAEQIARYVVSQGGSNLDPAKYDEDLKCDVKIVNGAGYQIAETREHALNELGESIAHLLQRVSTDRNVSGIIQGGGGSEHLARRIKASNLPAIIEAPNPRRSNVDGAYTFISEE